LKNMDRHTFAVVAYKDSPYLEECLLSLLRQTVKSEICISVSTPSLSVDRLAERYNIPILVNTKDGGIACDWTFAYNNCKTKYLTLAHYDDIYLPKYTERCLSAAGNKPFLIAFTDYAELMPDNTLRKISVNALVKAALKTPFLIKRRISSGGVKKAVLSFGNPIACPAVMYNREDIGYFEFSGDLSYNMDWDAWLRLSSRRGDFVYIKDRLLLHRLHKGSQTSLLIENKVRKQEELYLFRRLWPGPVARVLSDVYSLGAGSNKV